MIKDSTAYEYAKWCCRKGNKKIPKYVKMQAREWLKIAEGKTKKAFVDEEGYRKVKGILSIMIHPDIRKPMNEALEPYALFFITAVLCTMLKNEEGLNIRYYVTAILEIARKNFKTFVSAVIFIVLMLTDQPFSRFFSVAPDLSLSSELKLALRKIIKSSPDLIDESEPAFTLLRSEIRCNLNDNTYIPLAYSQDTMDGKLANAFLADEAGALDEYPVEAMRSSQLTLFNKLGIIISTQYPNDNNVMIDEIDIAKKSLDGVLADQRVFALLYEPDAELLQDDKWKKDDLVLYQANPIAVTHSYIMDELKKKRDLAVIYENKRENFLCKHCNIKYKGLGVEGYIDITKVRMCNTAEDLEFWKGKRVYVGMDLSMTDDNTAVAMCCTDEEGVIWAKTWGFLPADRLEEKTMKEKVDYRKMIKDECCFACGDEVIDYTYIEDFILSIPEAYGVEIVKLGYDKWNALSTVQHLEGAEDPIECVEIKQHSSVLHSPTKLLKERILSKTFHYEKNQLLEINFSNAKCTEDTNRNKYVNKKKSAGKVDMVVALINAMHLLEQELLHGSNFVVQTA